MRPIPDDAEITPEGWIVIGDEAWTPEEWEQDGDLVGVDVEEKPPKPERPPRSPWPEQEKVRVRITDERGEEIVLTALSKRQSEVALLIIEGITNRDAAEALGISVTTFDDLQQKVYRKLAVNNKVRLTRRILLMPEDARKVLLP